VVVRVDGVGLGSTSIRVEQFTNKENHITKLTFDSQIYIIELSQVILTMLFTAGGVTI
jgi:hypothetical protein